MFKMTMTAARGILRKARAAYTGDTTTVFPVAQVKEIMRAALTLLPSKELDPSWYLTRADTAQDIHTGNPHLEDGTDVRFCPKGLFEGVIGVKEIRGQTVRAAVAWDGYEYLTMLEQEAFAAKRWPVNGKALTLPEYRKKVYRAVHAAA
jgi:hypothetical protein